MSLYPIIDLHCDLLTYLQQDPKRTPYDPLARCAIPQLRQGGVKLQTMAIWAITQAGSSNVGLGQLQIFKELPTHYPQEFSFFSTAEQLDHLSTSKTIEIVSAIENASAIAEEDEPFVEVLKRLKTFETTAKPIYISLTWNSENRFGGGALTSIGLKEDGKGLLDYLHQKRISVDLSHASDQLAYDIFTHIDQHKLDIPVIASHSNFRAISNIPRNLPDELAQEIIRRKGIIGMNFVRSFIGGEEHPRFVEQLAHGLQLGAKEQMAWGADFYCDHDVPPDLRTLLGPSFFEDYADASAYPKVMGQWKKELGLSPTQLENIACGNVKAFLKRLL